nr:2980_t:CDS:2 [Entrophospora candida]
MNSICRQEVFGTEKIEKKGRRALNITKTTMKNINENKKAEKKTPAQFSDNSLQIQPVQIIRSFSESSYLQTQAQPHLHESVENPEQAIMNSSNKPARSSREAHKRRNKRLKWEHEHSKLEVDVPPIINQPTKCNIVFDPLKHRTQHASWMLSTYDKVHYLENEWKSIPLCPSDQISSKEIKTSPRDLLIETLIQEAQSTNMNPLGSFEIPPDFLTLVDSEIITPKNDNEIDQLLSADTNKHLWFAFGWWLGLDKDGKINRKKTRRYLKSKWSTLKHALDLQNNEDMMAKMDTQPKKNLIESARLLVLDKLVKFRYIIKPECITDLNGRTLIHLEKLDNQDAVMQATNAVNHYYFHTLNHPSHRSIDFWEKFIEHFGVYTRYNILPYTSGHTASTHNANHQECVDNLLHALEPLSAN